MGEGLRESDGTPKCAASTANILRWDEVWGFHRGQTGEERKEGRGLTATFWTFIALDADSKIIRLCSWKARHVSRARAFMEDLASRVTKRFQISSDALDAYAARRNVVLAARWTMARFKNLFSHEPQPKTRPADTSPAEVVELKRRL